MIGQTNRNVYLNKYICVLGNRLDDGKWHHLEIERRGGEGTFLLDGEQHQFNIPGQPPPLQVQIYQYTSVVFLL